MGCFTLGEWDYPSQETAKQTRGLRRSSDFNRVISIVNSGVVIDSISVNALNCKCPLVNANN
jgi:hypothetical protein